MVKLLAQDTQEPPWWSNWARPCFGERANLFSTEEPAGAWDAGPVGTVPFAALYRNGCGEQTVRTNTIEIRSPLEQTNHFHLKADPTEEKGRGLARGTRKIVVWCHDSGSFQAEGKWLLGGRGIKKLVVGTAGGRTSAQQGKRPPLLPSAASPHSWVRFTFCIVAAAFGGGGVRTWSPTRNSRSNEEWRSCSRAGGRKSPSGVPLEPGGHLIVLQGQRFVRLRPVQTTAWNLRDILRISTANYDDDGLAGTRPGPNVAAQVLPT